MTPWQPVASDFGSLFDWQPKEGMALNPYASRSGELARRVVGARMGSSQESFARLPYLKHGESIRAGKTTIGSRVKNLKMAIERATKLVTYECDSWPN